MNDHPIGSEAWWRAGGSFVWRVPRFYTMDPADKRPRFMLNRYPHNVIGAGFVLFGRGWCVQWKHTPRRSGSRPA